MARTSRLGVCGSGTTRAPGDRRWLLSSANHRGHKTASGMPHWDSALLGTYLKQTLQTNAPPTPTKSYLSGIAAAQRQTELDLRSRSM